MAVRKRRLEFGLGNEASKEKEDIKDLNGLSLEEVENIESCFIELVQSINNKKYYDSIRYLKWLKVKLDINMVALEQDKQRSKDKKHMHPIRARRGEIYLT